MREQVRPAAPDFLAEHVPRWTAEVHDRFQWPSHGGRRLNLHLLPLLHDMTRGHCSYCDHFPFGSGTVETIDHFQPKSQFPELRFDWPNLYLCCTRCQQAKGDRWDPGLLRPDAGDYRFPDWFWYDQASGELRPHPALDPERRARAEVTIALLGLNRIGLPEHRRRELRQFRELPPEVQARELYECSFVYLLGEHV